MCVPVYHKAQVHLYHYGTSDGPPDFLLLQRMPERGSLWQCVTGNAWPGETADHCARREVEEETAIALTGAGTGLVWTYRFQKGDRVFEEYVFGFETANRTVVLSQEHQGFEWMSPRQAFERIHFAGIREGLIHVCQALGAIPLP